MEVAFLMKAITGMYAFSLLVVASLMMSQPAQNLGAEKRRLLHPSATIRTGAVDSIGRIEYVPQTGNYRFTWRGYDGRLVQATYVPGWKARVTLIASAERLQDGTWCYTYTLCNLSDSPQQVTAVHVTTDAQPLRALVQKGWRFSGVLETHKGNAFEFCVDPGSDPHSPLAAGQQLCLQVFSKDPPAVGICFVSTDAPIMRVPEEMPGELEARLPLGLDGGLRGYTLSPSRRLSAESFMEHWRTAVKAGWVIDKRLVNRLTAQVEQTVKALRRGDRLGAQSALAGVQQLVLQHSQKIEPEAQALLTQSLPYLARRGQSAN